MRQLTGLDAQFLALESPRQAGHVSGLAILDPGTRPNGRLELAGPASPATDEKLAEQVARIFERPLDRSRPLWEAYLIHGLSGGHVALLTKIHHAVIDGMSGAEIMGVRFWTSVPSPRRRTSRRGHPARSVSRASWRCCSAGCWGRPATSSGWFAPSLRPFPTCRTWPSSPRYRGCIPSVAPPRGWRG